MTGVYGDFGNIKCPLCFSEKLIRKERIINTQRKITGIEKYQDFGKVYESYKCEECKCEIYMFATDEGYQ